MGSQTVLIQILNPWKVDSHPENFDQPERYNINRCLLKFSVIMVMRSEETLVTNSKRSARQLSSSSTISISILEICINDPDLSLPMIIESS